MRKIENSGKKHAHKIQCNSNGTTSKSDGKERCCKVYRSYIEKMKKITKQKMNEDVSRSDLDQIEKYADKLFA